MSYKLKFLPAALSEWKKLENAIQVRFKKKLKACLHTPRISKNSLFGYENHYKIQLQASDYRLVYEVADKEIYVLGIAVVKDENGLSYNRT